MLNKLKQLLFNGGTPDPRRRGRDDVALAAAAVMVAEAPLDGAFDAAELASRVQAGARPPGPAWQAAAKGAFTRTAEDIASVVGRWSRRGRDD